MEDQLRHFADVPLLRAAAIALGSIIAAVFVEIIVRRIIGALVRRAWAELEEVLVTPIHRPVLISTVLVGLSWAAEELPLTARMDRLLDSLLETMAVVIWSAAVYRIGVGVLGMLGRRGSGASIVQPRTLPVFEMLLKIAVAGTALYFAFLSWRIDLTAWLASAGIIGIAIGFAAKDTLANLFSGIFIVVDAPYKVGDFIVLDAELQGRVTKIGIRSTRVLTLDDVEVTVPNALIASSKIINETGGPYVKRRVHVGVDCAYGSDIDRVREVLFACPPGIPGVELDPAPEVHFLDFGASGLRFELRVWIANPEVRELALDRLHCAIYKGFTAAGIEIPFAKQDVYVKELPRRDAA